MLEMVIFVDAGQIKHRENSHINKDLTIGYICCICDRILYS